jgi:hypothetical protein
VLPRESPSGDSDSSQSQDSSSSRPFTGIWPSDGKWTSEDSDSQGGFSFQSVRTVEQTNSPAATGEPEKTGHAEKGAIPLTTRGGGGRREQNNTSSNSNSSSNNSSSHPTNGPGAAGSVGVLSPPKKKPDSPPGEDGSEWRLLLNQIDTTVRKGRLESCCRFIECPLRGTRRSKGISILTDSDAPVKELFIGQLVFNFNVEALATLLQRLARSESPVCSRVKVGPKPTCAFVAVRAEYVPTLLSFSQRLLCDWNGVWVADRGEKSEKAGDDERKFANGEKTAETRGGGREPNGAGGNGDGGGQGGGVGKGGKKNGRGGSEMSPKNKEEKSGGEIEVGAGADGGDDGDVALKALQQECERRVAAKAQGIPSKLMVIEVVSTESPGSKGSTTPTSIHSTNSSAHQQNSRSGATRHQPTQKSNTAADAQRQQPPPQLSAFTPPHLPAPAAFPAGTLWCGQCRTPLSPNVAMGRFCSVCGRWPVHPHEPVLACWNCFHSVVCYNCALERAPAPGVNAT